MRYHRILMGTICVLFTITFTSCGRAKDGILDRNEMVYEAQSIMAEGVNDRVGSFAVKDGRIYMYTTPLEKFLYDEDGKAFVDENLDSGALYSMEFDGSSVKELPIPKVDGNIVDIQIASSVDSIKMLIKYEKKEIEGYIVVEVDDDGMEQRQCDITEKLKLQNDESVDKLLNCNSNRYVVVTDRRILLLDMEGKKIWEYISPSGYIQSVARSKGGDILSANVTDEGIKIDVLDVNDGSRKNRIVIEKNVPMNGNLLIDGVDYDFYYRDSSGIYGYQIKGKQTRKILDYAASGIYAENVDSMIPVSVTQMVGIADARATDGSKMILYTKVNSTDVQEKTVLTYAAIQIDSKVKDAVIDFNHSSNKYRIQVKEYYMESDPEQSFTLDLISNNPPDIIDMSGMSINQYVKKGVLEDLTLYYEKDEGLGIEDMIPSVAKAMQINGGYYYISPGFRLISLVGKTSLLGETSGWTIDEMVSFKEKHPDSQLLYNEDQNDIFAVMLEENMDNFIDWHTGICSFDSEEFQKLLVFCKTYTVEKQKNVLSGEELDMLRKDKVILTQVNIGAESMQIYPKVYGEDVVYKGYPSAEDQGTYFDFSSTIGMAANSKNKEGVWEFLRSLMTEQYQTMNLDIIMGGSEDVVPTRQDAFELYKRSRMIVKPYTDEYNRLVDPLDTSVGFDSLEIELKPLTGEQMNEFVQLVERTTSTRNVDIEIEKLVLEEVDSFFADQQTLDKTIEVIQDRTTKYVNENR